VDADGDGLSDVEEDDEPATGGRSGYDNYNDTRTRFVSRPVDILGDDLDEPDETFRLIKDLDGQLQNAEETAVASISKRSARTGRNPETEKQIQIAFDDMDRLLSEMQAVLERCSDESCVAASENVVAREAGLQRAREHVENGEWDAAIEVVSNPLYEKEAIAPPEGRLSDAQRAKIAEYLAGEPVIGERFSVCLPDAEVPGGNGSIKDEVTPKRLIDYITGQSDGSSQVYSWGDPDSDDDGLPDCEEIDDGREAPGLERVCGRSTHLVADVSGPTATGGGLEVIRGDNEVALVPTSPVSLDMEIEILMTLTADPIISGPDDGGKGSDGPESSTEAIYQAWSGESNGGGTGSSIDSGFVVAQVMVQPPGCSHPFPALLYVARGQSDGQLVYTGGWIIDDAALYADSLTVLTMAGETPVVPVDIYDFDSDGDGFSDGVLRSLSGERARRGARLDVGTVESLVESGVLSERMVETDDILRRKRPGRRSDDGGGGGRVALTHLALDAPVLHVVNAETASNEVKFKTGAELSKSVN
jgi:hypothetical protein